jgi:hypothetical protein
MKILLGVLPGTARHRSPAPALPSGTDGMVQAQACRPAIPENAERGIRDEHAGAPFVASDEDRLVPASRD